MVSNIEFWLIKWKPLLRPRISLCHILRFHLLNELICLESNGLLNHNQVLQPVYFPPCSMSFQNRQSMSQCRQVSSTELIVRTQQPKPVVSDFDTYIKGSGGSVVNGSPAIFIRLIWLRAKFLHIVKRAIFDCLHHCNTDNMTTSAGAPQSSTIRPDFKDNRLP